jgi:hypothetical protein
MLYDRTYAVSSRGSYKKPIKCTDGIKPLIIRSGAATLGIYGP